VGRESGHKGINREGWGRVCGGQQVAGENLYRILRNVGSIDYIYTAPHPEDGILHSHRRRENLKSYIFTDCFPTTWVQFISQGIAEV
jgi:hypothetical protein